MPSAMSRVNVRHPTWSSTTVTWSSESSGSAQRSESAAMVRAKFLPSPMTQLEHTMYCFG